MKLLQRSIVLLSALAAASCVAQIPAPGAAPAAGAPQAARPIPNPTNLKVLPKTMTGAQVVELMHKYTGDLGVNCAFCHAVDPETKRTNFASDANPMKDTARFMMTMTADLNDKYLADMPGRMTAEPITCGTCHRGAKYPSVFVPAPRAQMPPSAGATPPPATPPPGR